MQHQEAQIRNLLEKGVSRVIDRENLEKKLRSGKVLRVKFGIDPTGTSVHIGHAVPILKLRAFQELGHQVVLIIGDSTAQVGDTSDKESERPMLTRDETRKNAEDYLSQFGQILDLSKVEVHYNSEWMDTTNFNMVGELAKRFSVAEMLDRDNFSKRYKGGIRISLQEFLYPLMQGWDSVKIHADVELGGNDQYFNLLAGRTLQEAFGQEKQDILTFNLLEGTDGRKMSKSYKNFIAVNEAPNEMFIKIMEVADELIVKYFVHATTLTLEEVQPYETRISSGENPRAVKLDLATMVVGLYHGESVAADARSYFERVLSSGGIPNEDEIELRSIGADSIPLLTLLRDVGFCSNSSEARNAVTGGGVRVNNESVTDLKFVVELSDTPILVQSGKKRFIRVCR